MAFDLHDRDITVSYVFVDEEVAVSLTSRPLPRIGESVSIGGATYKVINVAHRISQHDPIIQIFLR
jgi:hypothetical protein